MTEQMTFTEAPASINVRFTLRGFDAQLILRDVSGKALLDKMSAALDTLEKLGAEPSSHRDNGNGPDNGNGTGQANGDKPAPKLENGQADPAWCPIHQCAMKRREKDGQVWYSHKVGDDWCRGK